MGKDTNVLKGKDLQKKQRPSSFTVLSCFQGASIKGSQYIASSEAKTCPPEAPQTLAAGCTPIRPLIFCDEIF